MYVYNIQNTRPERYGYWTNGCGKSCVNSPEDGSVGPKYVEIRRYMNKIETVTSVGFSLLEEYILHDHLPTNYAASQPCDLQFLAAVNEH